MDSMSKEDLMTLLHDLTGFPYIILERRSGSEINTSYHIVALSIEERFYTWYAYNKAKDMFFKNMADAVLHFIRYWVEWKSIGEPEPW